MIFHTVYTFFMRSFRVRIYFYFAVEECWEASLPDSRCDNYAEMGFTCVGDFCSIISPNGADIELCATYVGEKCTIDSATGRCVGCDKKLSGYSLETKRVFFSVVHNKLY